MPSSFLTVPPSRTTGVAAFAVIGTNLDARSVAANTDAGWFAVPFTLPPNADPSYPSYVRARFSRGPGTVPLNSDILLRLRTTYLNLSDTVVDLSLSNLVNVQGTWDPATPREHTFDDGSGATFPGHTFHADSLIGFEFTRRGSDPLDTFTLSLLLAAQLQFIYHLRCQHVCCP